MPSLDLLMLYERLHAHFGSQGWWPTIQEQKNGADARFEICVGAILTQNTAWTNVEKALRNLLSAGLIDPKRLLTVRKETLCRAIRPAGYFNQKAKKLKHFASCVQDAGGLNKLFALPLPKLRETLLKVWGIGPETADSIILYAARKPVFVIDAYTKRLLHLFNIRFRTYEGYQAYFENQLPRRAKLWNEYHALIVAWGKLFAKDKEQAITIIR